MGGGATWEWRGRLEFPQQEAFGRGGRAVSSGPLATTVDTTQARSALASVVPRTFNRRSFANRSGRAAGTM
jgi:hypothetical protein